MSLFYQPILVSFEECQKIDWGNRLLVVLEALDAERLLRGLHEERRASVTVIPYE